MKKKTKKLLTMSVTVLAVMALFASFLAITSFTNRVQVNRLTENTSTTVTGAARDLESTVAEVKYSNSFGPEAEALLTKIGNNLDYYIQENSQKAEVMGSSGDVVQQQPAQAPSQGVNLNGYEQQILAEINNIRVANGLSPLVASQALTDIARSRSADMLSRGYFSHYTPEGTNIFNILQGYGITYRNAGENLAHAQPASAGSPGVFANAWMNSSTHRANILRDAYGQIGIGLAENGNRRVVTTVFMN
ncbi:MAG: CAP domain-containing protein [Actinomycetia bacterium]|nr:CAP domain-containing protein [Actinomycetes bacterium]